MDNNIKFVKTRKGQDEAHGKTSHLAGDVRRALLMVDGNSTFEEIRRRAAPSLRNSLDELFEELEKNGYIQDKENKGKPGNVSKGPPPKAAMPPGMVVPSRDKSRPKHQEAGEDLDFMSGFSGMPKVSNSAIDAAEIAAAEAAAEAAKKESEEIRLKAEMEAKLRLEAEERERKRKAEEEARKQKELEEIRRKAEMEARLRIEAEERARKQAEEARIRAEQEEARRQKELEEARLKAEMEARLRLEAEERERKRKEEEEARRQKEIEEARLKAEIEARLRLEAEERERKRAEEERIRAEQEEARKKKELEEARIRAETEVRLRHETEARERQLAEERIRAEAEAKVRLEAEAKVRLEAEAKAYARIKAEEEAAAKVREADERAAKAAEEQEAEKPQDDDMAKRMASELSQAFGGAPSPQGKTEDFSFGLFDLGQSATAQPEAPKSPPATPQAAPGGFAFDSFQVEAPHPPTEPPKGKTAPEQGQQPPVRQPEVRSQTRQQPEPSANKPAGPSEEQQAQRAMQARIAAEQKAAAEAQSRKKAADERAAKEAEAKKAAEDAAKEAESRKVADNQAKAWAEAEKRALETAKSSAQKPQRPAEKPVAESAHAHAAEPRTARKSSFAGKLAGILVGLVVFLLILGVAALFAVPYFFPWRDYMPMVEKQMSARLHQPVHLGQMSGRILPSPRLELGEIYLGDAKQFQAAQAYLNFSFNALFDDVRPIDSIDFQDVKVRGIGLLNSASWLQQFASDKQYPIARMNFSQGVLDADAFELKDIAGNMDFGPGGKFIQANLKAGSGKYTLKLDADGNSFRVAFGVSNGELPLLPNWTFDNLTAKGMLKDSQLDISDFSGHIMGGSIQGKASLDWRSGWHAQGTIDGKTIDISQMNKLLDVKIDGSGRFGMASPDLAGLTGMATFDGDFKTSSDGVISGIDIAETVHKRSREHLPGGRTSYDSITGSFSCAADGSFHFRQVKIAAKVLNATANFDIVNKQQLSGKMSASSTVSDGPGSAVLQLGGTIDSPTLRYGP